MRIAFISNHPAPYRDSFIGYFIKYANATIDVFSELSYDPGHMFWNLEEKSFYKKDALVSAKDSFLRTTMNFIRRFVVGEYDLVVWPGLLKPYVVIPILLSALLGKRFVFSADTVEQRKVSWLAHKIKRYIARKAMFVFVPGKAGQHFWMHEFGLPKENIIVGSYALDGKLLEDKIRTIREIRRDCVRKELNIGVDDVVFLMVANMIPSRCYPITANAFIKFAQKHPGVKFVMVGNGPDQACIQELERNNDCLRVVPGCSFEKIMDLYGMADVYVHGGKEPASTALVIGAIAMLPLISSRAVGCSHDCLKNGVSGVEIPDYKSAEQWVDGFEDMLCRRASWGNMGRNARQLSMELDADYCAENFAALIAERLS